jgi:hypothetical protein
MPRIQRFSCRLSSGASDTCRVSCYRASRQKLMQCAIIACNWCRAARVVVMTDEKFRAKFGYVLDTRFQACLIGVWTLVMMCAPASLQPTHHAHDPQYCMSFEPFELWLSVLIVIAWLYGYMIYRCVSIVLQRVDSRHYNRHCNHETKFQS